jgi:16S rRNA (adenine1518-N6/adenine1519-N6)-dimethyltransferase
MSSANPRPLKKFGQNFLINDSMAERIVDALEIQPDDCVVEIGPGKGALTRRIISRGAKEFHALEVDARMVELLAQELPTGVDIVPKSVMDIAFADFAGDCPNRIKVVGNIPYNITSPILFKLLDAYRHITCAVLMVQKEVADRLLAGPGNKQYGIPTVLTAVHATVTSILNVGRGNFFPVPGVDSTVIRLDFFPERLRVADYSFFRRMVKTVFNTRRKMLQTSLRSLFPREVLEQIESVALTRRPEQLSVQEFIDLADELELRAGGKP